MTNEKPLLLGSHVSMSGKKMLLGSSEDALSYGATTFMIYTGAPQNTRRKPIEELNIEAGCNIWRRTELRILSSMHRILLILQIRRNQQHLHLVSNFYKKKLNVLQHSEQTKLCSSRCTCWCWGRSGNCKNY